MSDRVFLDTNVLVYLFDTDAPAKQRQARSILAGTAEGVAGAELVLSTQVLQEFYVAVTRKLARPVSGADALAAMESLCELPVVQVDPQMVLAAAAGSQRRSLSFWDALIVEAAIAGGCSRLLTEGLQHEQAFNDLRIENPF